MKKILLGAVVIGTALYFAPQRSPMGLVDATVTKEMVCVPGYSTSVRPPKSYTESIKRAWLKTGKLSDYELDHIVPISLGGSPKDPKNLQMEPFPEAHYKDTVEWDLYHKLCKGEITLQEAQKRVKDWVHYFKGMNLGGVNVYTADQDDE